jgi:hypothetical protein
MSVCNCSGACRRTGRCDGEPRGGSAGGPGILNYDFSSKATIGFAEHRPWPLTESAYTFCEGRSTEVPEGWRCPNCKVINAPMVLRCPCTPAFVFTRYAPIIDDRYPVGQPENNLPDPSNIIT